MNSEMRLERARDFLTQVFTEAGIENALSNRLKEVEHSIRSTGTYEHTAQELTAGARMAWRNSNRCVGRLFWKSLKVVDARAVKDFNEICSAIQNHLDYVQQLGATTLWLNPVWENDMPDRTEHGYAFTNHYVVDPRLGGNKAYHELVNAAHTRGLKVIQDAV